MAYVVTDFALEKKWEQNYGNIGQKPELFNDSIYQDLITNNALSTSCIADASVDRFIFGPVERDGFGIAYSPDTEKLKLTISYYNENLEKAARFLKELEPAARYLQRLLDLEETG